MLELKVKYHTDAAKGITQAHEGEWIDLKTAVDTNINKGQRMVISLGVSIQLPEGYEALLTSRSSTFKNFGILQTNPPGVIDYLYCGNDDVWGFAVFATKDIHIPAGTRIAQFRIQPVQPKLNIIEVDNLNSKNRGGFGSTGR